MSLLRSLELLFDFLSIYFLFLALWFVLSNVHGRRKRKYHPGSELDKAKPEAARGWFMVSMWANSSDGKQRKDARELSGRQGLPSTWSLAYILKKIIDVFIHSFYCCVGSSFLHSDCFGCGELGPLFLVVHRLLIVVFSLVVEQELQGTQVSVLVVLGLSCSTVHEIFPDHGSNRVPCIGRWILNYWTTKEVPWILLEGDF